MFRPFLLILLMLIAAPLAAQEEGAFRFGEDAYLAGQTVTHRGDAVDDLFMAGDRVSAQAPVMGSAHMAGRYVTIADRVGNSLYAAGMNIDLTGEVAGDALLVGETLRVQGPVGGDLRATGNLVEVNQPVGASLLVGAETLELDAAIAGDASIAANDVTFGPGARVDGVLHIYHDDPGRFHVPDTVVSADRIERHVFKDWDGVGMGDVARVTWWGMAKRIIGGIVVVGLAATALAALAPGFILSLRERALARPGRTIWMGFIGLSAVAGSVVLFALTGIGLLLVPVSIILGLLLGFAGYVIGTYVLGVALTGAFGRAMPETLPDRAIAAFAGALFAGIIALIPFLGWIFALGLALIGAGALIVRFLAPGFFTATT